MFHLFDFGNNNKANEHESTPPHPTEEKLDEVQILEQAQSRLPAFCPHSSPFATSCSSILSGFEWYAEEPLLGIEGSEPLLAAAPPPTVDFRANTTDDRTGLDQALLSFEGSTASSEDLMHRPSAQQPENRHPINSIIAAADECSPPFVVDTLTISCPRNVTSSAPTSPLTDPPNDDDHVPSLLVTVAASPQVAPPPDDAMTIDDISTDAILAPVVEMSLDVASLPTQPSSIQQHGNEPAGDNHSASAHVDDPAVGSSRDLDTNSDDDDDEGAEEPQLSPRLVDAGALYDAYLLRRAQLDAQGEWPTSPTTSSGRSDDDDDIDGEEDDDDGHSDRLSNHSYVGLGRLYYDDDSEDEDDYDDDEERAIYVREVLSSVGGWPQDQRALHRRNEDFPYHTYKPPAVGDSFQAVLPALLPEALRLRAPAESVSGGDQPVAAAAAGDDADIVDDDGPRHEELVWSPDSVADDQVEDYLAHVRQLVDADDFSEEKALIELHRHNYDVCGALASLLVDPAPFHKDRWSETEKVALLAGWSLYWKNWRMIQTMVPSRSTGEIMQFYYQNKPRADHLRRQRAEHDDDDDSEEEEQQQQQEEQEEEDDEEEDDAELEAVTTLAEAATRSPSSSSSASSPHQPLPTSPHERSDLAPSPVHSQLRGEAADDMDAAASSDDDADADDAGREEEDGDVDGDDGDSSCREDGKEEGFGGQEIRNGARRGGSNNKRKRDDQQQHDDDNDAATVADEALPGDGEGHDRSEEDEERASSSKRARLERDEAAARLRVPQQLEEEER